MKKELKDYKNIYMIGIGGASMYSIAAMLKNDGKNVSGSDMQESDHTKYLESIGIPVAIGHDISYVKNADLVIYTAAISKDDEELVCAHNQGIECVDRAEFLGEYTKSYENLICISGTHGKSTTTSMIASIFLEAEYNPTVNIGAALKKINGNYYIGGKKYFILEACEYVDSFLHFHPTSEIILNIDDDHLDYFKNMENMKKSFQKYIDLLPQDGCLVLNRDDENISDLVPHNNHVLTYGIDSLADITAKNIKTSKMGFPTFDAYYKNEFYETITLGVLGRHNILNALASIAISINYNIDKESVKKALKEFRGVGRRFEYLGEYKGAHFFDDFAHHPTEIDATFESSKAIDHHETWAVFQSHTYSRTYEHLEEFADVLSKFDHVIICDIYPARETNIWNVKEDDLVALIKKKNPHVKHIATYSEIAKYLDSHIRENDLVLTIGAGPINQVANMLLKQ